MKRNQLCRNKNKVWWRRFGFFAVCLLLCLPPTAFGSDSQPGKRTTVTLELKRASIRDVLSRLNVTAGYDFAYRVDDLPAEPLKNYSFKGAGIGEVMEKLLHNTDLVWVENNGIITITKKTARTETNQPVPPRRITGRVLDESTRKPLAGAAIMVPGTQRGTTTDSGGNYAILVPDGGGNSATLEVRFIGYETQTVSLGGRTEVDVYLKVDNKEIETVTVTDGVTQRKAESYTGAAVTIKKDELQLVGNGNIFQSLRNLDPSLYIMDNFEMGSDPNTLPVMNMRGTTSFDKGLDIEGLKGNYENVPNMPLFILDGFETTTERVFDMDMNRVETITLLKDAAAKALYGSKAANGVVIIETTKLRSNEPRVTYVASLDIEMPDLSSYNLCSPMEKLDVEFIELYYRDSANDMNNTALKNYYDKRKEVLEGLYTDWMAKPVRKGIGHKHSLTVELGKDDLRVLLGVSYNNTVGTMKGSDRTAVTGDAYVNYNFKKFRLSNKMTYSQTDSRNSPFGGYNQYSLINPYENMYDDNGQIRPTLSNGPNPYYDGMLKTRFERTTRNFSNNTEIEWRAFDGFIVRGRLGITTNNIKASDYYPANHSSQLGIANMNERGKFTVNNGDESGITGNLTFSYSKTFGEKHIVYATGYAEVGQKENQEVMHTVVGLPSDNMDDILYALKYQDNSQPKGNSNIRREAVFTGMASYSWDNRFISDFTLRKNATSMFGTDKRWATFWSVGVGWNLHREAILAGTPVHELKLRASVGSTGDQSQSANKSFAQYQYNLSDRYDGRVGGWLMNMENPWLQWQKRMDYNIGLNATVHELTLMADFYRSVSESMVSSLTLPPSTGFTSVNENVGKVENKGFEIKLNYRIYNRKRDFIRLNASLASNKNKLLRISDAMKEYNQRIIAQYGSTQVSRIGNALSGIEEDVTMMPPILYFDGRDMNTIWAVRSAGIDPATGMEAYYGKDGRLTYIYKGSDLQEFGSTTPKLRGTFGFNGEIKRIGISVTFRYEWGGYYFNATLRDKIENISVTQNFDRRALSQRWRYIDQSAYFKRLYEKDVTEVTHGYSLSSGEYWPNGQETQMGRTQTTSRFIQRRNDLTLSQVTLYYDFDSALIKKIGLQRLKLSAYMNDIHTFSTIGMERGTSYPFARKISFSLTGTF